MYETCSYTVLLLQTDCGDLTAPLFGDVAVDSSGHVATYTCNLGYMISGAQIRRCEDNEWLGSTPICIVTGE